MAGEIKAMRGNGEEAMKGPDRESEVVGSLRE